ncbi:MAG: acyl carrier protein [Acidovorax sp.]
MNQDIYNRLAELLVQKFQLDPAALRPEATLESLGLDSLGLMDFVFSAEDSYGLRIPEELLDPRQGSITLARVVDVVEGQLAAKAAA